MAQSGGVRRGFGGLTAIARRERTSPDAGDLAPQGRSAAGRFPRHPDSKAKTIPCTVRAARHCRNAPIPVNGPRTARTPPCWRPPAAGPVAQWLEPAAHNGLVAGSSPAGPTSRSRTWQSFRAVKQPPQISPKFADPPNRKSTACFDPPHRRNSGSMTETICACQSGRKAPLAAAGRARSATR